MTPLPFVLAASIFFSYEPAAPTVGDPIRIEYAIEEVSRIVPDVKPEYEIVSVEGGALVVRSFRPGKFTVTGAIERDGVSEAFRGPGIEVRSVLGENDNLEPAPVKPPVVPPPQQLPRIVIVAAAAGALLAWAAVFLMKKGDAPLPARVLGADERFLAALDSLRSRPFNQAAVAEVAELTRNFLASRDPALSRELTTTELVTRLMESPDARLAAPVRDVLREGDLAKFSPWGSRFEGMAPLVDRAKELVG